MPISLQRIFRRGAALPAALLALSLLALPAAADPSRLEKVQQKKDRAARAAAAAEAEGDRLAQRVAALDRLRDRAEAEVSALQADLDRLDQRIVEKQRQLTHAQKRMAILTQELQDILGRIGIRTDVFVERAVAAYKAGPTAYVEGVLSSGSFTDLVDRYEYYQAALDADSALLDEIEVLRNAVDMRRTEVDQRQAEITEAKMMLQVDRAAVDAIHEQKAAVLAERNQIVAEKENLLGEARGRQRRFEAIVAQLERDEDAIRAAIAAAGSTASGAFPTGGGQLLWPAAGPTTSGYGYRTHPIFGDSRMHTGIDIGAPYGAPVIAADDGSVVFVGAMGGYGNVVVIDHGGGLSTTYNHLGSYLVSTGQSVSRGSQVATIGCSGYCTGPHLHFEVRVNGSPVDPMPYLQ